MENNLYIKLFDGAPINHPISEENLKLFFPNLDPKFPPEGFARFVRKPEPEIDDKHIIEGVNYGLSEELTKQIGTPTYTDYYSIREINAEEKQNIIDRYLEMNPQQSEWIFDEDKNALVPPVPKPHDGQEYVWMYPNPSIGENTGRWVKQSDVVDASPQEFDEMFQAMKELGMETNVPQQTVKDLISNIKGTVVVPPDEEPIRG